MKGVNEKLTPFEKNSPKDNYENFKIASIYNKVTRNGGYCTQLYKRKHIAEQRIRKSKIILNASELVPARKENEDEKKNSSFHGDKKLVLPLFKANNANKLKYPTLVFARKRDSLSTSGGNKSFINESQILSINHQRQPTIVKNKSKIFHSLSRQARSVENLRGRNQNQLQFKAVAQATETRKSIYTCPKIRDYSSVHPLLGKYEKLFIRAMNGNKMQEEVDGVNMPYLERIEKEYKEDIRSIKISVEHLIFRYLDEKIFETLKSMMKSKLAQDYNDTISTSTLNVLRKKHIDIVGEKKEKGDLNYQEMIPQFNHVSKTLAERIYMKSVYACYQKGEIIAKEKKLTNVYFFCSGIALLSCLESNYKKKVHPAETVAHDLVVETEWNPTGLTKHSYDELILKAVSKCELLEIPRSTFSLLISDILQEEEYFKLYTIKKCKLFTTTKMCDILFFALQTKLVVKHFCETIIRQDTIPNCCYIVASGQCKAVYEYTSKKKSEGLKRKKLPKLVFGAQNNPAADKLHEEKGKPKKVVRKQNFSYPNQILFENDQGEIGYSSHVSFGLIKPGEYFSGWALIKDYPVFQEKCVSQTHDEKEIKSQLTIIADSAEVELIEVNVDALNTINTDSRLLLFEEIIRYFPQEQDRPFLDIEKLKDKIVEHQTWKQFKEKLQEEVIGDLRNKKMDRSISYSGLCA